VPEGTLLNPRRPAAVSGGNVETSMRNADLVLAALATLAPGRVPAQSGGSMNNVMIGGLDGAGRSWAFYETNGCGMGARPAADGIDAIHVHMTNTLNTPIEAIERAMPMRITTYEFAEGSAGEGTFRGGSGLVRGFALVAGTATASLLAERHVVRPLGEAGGGDGAVGMHTFVDRSGATRTLAAKTTVELEPCVPPAAAAMVIRRNARPKRARATLPTRSESRRECRANARRDPLACDRCADGSLRTRPCPSESCRRAACVCR